MKTKIDLTFPHDYEIEEVEQFPSETGIAKRLFYPGGLPYQGEEGLVVKIDSNAGISWLGVFAFGYPTTNSVTGIFSCPDEKSACIISAGQGYILRVDDPTDWRLVEAFPILDARAIATKRLLLFTDFTKMTAYGFSGPVWTTPQLSSDGVEITHVTSQYVAGSGWDAAKGRSEFLIDLSTGGVTPRGKSEDTFRGTPRAT